MTVKTRIVYQSGLEKILETKVINRGIFRLATLSPEEVGTSAKYVDFCYDGFTAAVGEAGYFVSNRQNCDTLTRFTSRPDQEIASEASFVACFGHCRGTAGTLAIVTGMRCDFGQVMGVRDGVYYLFPRFYLDGDLPYEEIAVEFYDLEDGSYSGMARCYRQFQLTRGGCRPLAERAAEDPRLGAAADAVEVRVRQAWKPVPSPVEYQTPETEPPLHVACTFDRVRDMAEEFARRGVREAEFCLVGWNYGGHDGRFPQIFPPDPRLGGWEGLKSLIFRVKELGYGMVCHDDATAAYTIADCFDEEYLLKNQDGSLHRRPYCWGGGRPHKICPQRQYECFELPNQEALARLGFQGIHYIDVMTILPLLKCYDPKHPLTRKDSAAWYRKIMTLSRENFGGFGSESGFDYAADSLDYSLYTGFAVETDLLCDRVIPFWELVYHGIILYNPSTYTLNYPAKAPENRLKYFEFGGRPLACWYANFATGNNWMGREDLICDTEEQLRAGVEAVRKMAADYELLKPVRYCFMESHEELAEGVFRTTYSNGTTVTVDYGAQTVDIRHPS